MCNWKAVRSVCQSDGRCPLPVRALVIPLAPDPCPLGQLGSPKNLKQKNFQLRQIIQLFVFSLQNNFFPAPGVEKKLISIFFQFVPGTQQRFFASFSEEKVTFNLGCQIFQCCGCYCHGSVPTSRLAAILTTQVISELILLSYSYNSCIFLIAAHLLTRKMRHIVFVLNFMTLRLTLLQIHKLFTLRIWL